MKRLMDSFGGGGMPSMEDMDPKDWPKWLNNLGAVLNNTPTFLFRQRKACVLK